MSKTGSKQARVVCPECGEDMAVKTAEKHHDAIKCEFLRTRREMESIGFVRVKGIHEVLLGAGITLKRAATSIVTGQEKPILQEGFWGPAWAVNIAQRSAEFDVAARHVILHQWKRSDDRKRAVLETLAAAASARELLLYCLGEGRCCQSQKGARDLIWRKYERYQNEPGALSIAMRVHLLAPPIGG